MKPVDPKAFDRKAAEAALCASEEQYHAMFNASIDGLALWNARGEIVDAVKALAERVRGRPVADFVAAAPTAVAADELPFPVPAGSRVAVRVAAAITHTIGGLRVDDGARVLDAAGAPVPELYAAGVDAGGVATGGYASGLAAALVLGLAAAESVSR